MVITQNSASQPLRSSRDLLRSHAAIANPSLHRTSLRCWYLYYGCQSNASQWWNNVREDWNSTFKKSYEIKNEGFERYFAHGWKRRYSLHHQELVKKSALSSLNLLETPTAGGILSLGKRPWIWSYHYREKWEWFQKIFWKFKCPRKDTIVTQTTDLKRDRETAEKVAKNLEKSVWDNIGLPSEATFRRPKNSRVAIARALSMIAILFDEPASRLDPEMVGEVLKDHAGPHKEGLTMIVVTLKMEFALMSLTGSSSWDKGSLLRAGEIQKKCWANPKKGPRNFISTLLTNLLKQFNFTSMGLSVFQLLFKAWKKNRGSLWFLAEQQN